MLVLGGLRHVGWNGCSVFLWGILKNHWKKHPSGTDPVGSGSCDRMSSCDVFYSLRMRAGAHDKAALLAPSIYFFLVYDMY